MRRGCWALVAGGIAAIVGSPLRAADEPLAWLARMSNASQKQSYAGVVVYQHGQRSETSRIVHVVDGAGERERLEVLDGSPREVLRVNGEVKCYWPSAQMVILEKQDKRAFPATLPSSPESLAENYNLKLGAVVRVAGRDSQEVILEPRDALRYGHVLWADVASGLLLKSSVVDENKVPMEQFSFTEVQVGGNINKDALKSPLASQAGNWKVHDARASQGIADSGGWSFKTQIPGFRQVAGMKRRLHEKGGEALHLVFSDGLATVSVFVESHAGRRNQAPGFFTAGNNNVYKRVVGDQLVTVLGEVPPQALKRLADGMERN